MSILRVILFACVAHIMAFQLAWGETAYDRQGDVIPPGAELYEGVLDRINIEQDAIQSVIINDTSFRIDQHTKVKTASGGSTSLTKIAPGTHLEYYALEGLLTKVMLVGNLKTNGTVNDPAKTAPAKASAPVKLQDGVWKN